MEKLCRKPKKKLKQALRKQLKYVKKDLEFIDTYLHDSPERMNLLSLREISELTTIRELYKQQQKMFDEGVKSVENRIDSISQPHVRPIVRGKAGSAVEAYAEEFGYYPEVV